ncbi:lipoyl(octanoyl) transferase LipB [Corynebacterium sp. CCM 9185]|uniref:Octanoyltransferase n=1 Tax=Corynebacterium marambiense TaxID=2765364 RepID=A0ABS0VVX7_9CORY|nr:lipoyl(octanoyl) transferase LipB [Corynebacterium marambiense]MBI9000909.1 lipoyl(octanoyl) transferase LipB [Corynebacterium marambiense]MCK7662823.1 lipoyl(octanoyl) transferase LipB [Corynebacterium marambiense]MCX7542432.1 lipoyl(octanoyl) transferase LipB [Corynebacterium marambiense]
MTAPRPPFTPADSPIRDCGVPLLTRELGEVDYLKMWHEQAEIAAARASGEVPDQLLMLTHPSTYTAGKRTQPSDRPTNGVPCVDVDRGGRITWHGPGQLVCYPIIKLVEPIDVVDYVRRIEEALIQVIRQAGLPEAGRIEGRSGVWLPADGDLLDRKVAALGIRVTRGVTMHGLALNCCNALSFYEHIVPCGISDAGVTTLTAELGRTVTPEEMITPLATALDDALSGRLTVADHTLGTAPDPCAPVRSPNATSGSTER